MAGMSPSEELAMELATSAPRGGAGESRLETRRLEIHRPLDPQALLALWERGHGRSPEHQALALLSAALPEASAEELAALPLGRRDDLLLSLRQATLGPRLKGYVECPSCGVTVDFQLPVSQLRAAGEALGETEALPGPEPRTDWLEQAGYRVRFRLLTSQDLALAAEAPDLEDARQRLLEGAVVEAYRDRQGAAEDGAPEADPPEGGWERVGAEDLPPEVIEALGWLLEEQDPMAELPLALDCAHCSHRWVVQMEVGTFVWAELGSLAERLLYDIRDLARYYGWSESEILALSPVRRQFYLDQIAR